jgi:hypothetical protein
MTARAWLAVAACLSAPLAARAERVDLTAYVAPRPQVGDYRVYSWREGDSGSSWRDEVASVEDLSGGWRVVWERNGATAEEVVRAGARSRGERRSSPSLGHQLAVDYELRSFDLELRAGAARRYRQTFLDFVGPILPLPAWVRHRGRYRFAGFEAIETPYAGHAAAARVDSEVKEWHGKVRLGEDFEVESRGPMRLAWVKTSESWFVEGVGLVGVRTRLWDSFLGTITREVWLQEARIQGVPYP